jgi:hypothetical protein
MATLVSCSKSEENLNNSGNITAGSLSKIFTSAELDTITVLTLKGTIDARDFVTMRDSMPKLAVLDLSGTTIVDYNGANGTLGTTSLDYPANTVPVYAFNKDTIGVINLNLINIKLPSSVTSIGFGAFMDCCGLTSISIPSSVTSIGIQAFMGCRSLTSVAIPSSLTSLGYGAFLGCSGLTNSITIPSGVTSIEDWTFGDCIGLKSIVIPSSVTSIGDYAFYFCMSLTSIYAYPTTPVDLSSSPNVFTYVPYTCTLFVHTASISAYKTAAVWKSFSNIVGM